MHAIIFADLAGFTARTEAHGDQESVDLVQQFERTIKAILPPNSHLVKIVGDAAMIIGDVDDAARLAVDLMSASEELPGRPALRIGVHAGDVIERQGDYWGHAVNVAARVASQARPCEILLTEVVRNSVEANDPELAARLHTIGEQHLRNVSQPMALFSVISEEPELYTDPVCRMRIRESESAGRLTLEGQEYLFCSLDCLTSFIDTARNGQPQAPRDSS